MITLEKAKLVAKDIGNPKALLAGLTEEQTKAKTPVRMGLIIGQADKIVPREDSMGRVFDELRGSFKMLPANPVKAKDESGKEIDVEALVSTKALLPLKKHGEIVKALKGQGVKAVQFGFYADVVKAENPAGYEWILTDIFPVTAEAADPLAGVMARIEQATAEPSRAAAE